MKLDMKYKKYDAFIEESKILDGEDKSLDDIQKGFAELISDDLDDDIKRLLIWEGQLFICCEIPLEQREDGQQFLYPQLIYTNGTNTGGYYEDMPIGIFG